MPKIKTRKSIAKRFKVTKSGKVRKLGSAFHSHILSKKGTKQKRRHRAASFVEGSQARSIRRYMGQ
ncbi:MAG: 50S ribosomal protein L35 [Planctomycetes bacterium]|nr:50S ribosomal protein L35 [Planctomycetota bacterium]MCB9829166.1 50S ribosomal protein L35 [Planctomycetota bacterium]MCB9901280.1 50S ribosomal protein L35 [Planctomycetota bacterium]